jgi:hypothetical protein
MPRVRVGPVWGRECLSVFVGIRRETLTVEQICVRTDGGLSARGFVHYPLPGHTPAGEMMIVFGLTDFRRFSPSDSQGIRAYIHRLERDLRDEAPRVLSAGPTHRAGRRTHSAVRNAR